MTEQNFDPAKEARNLEVHGISLARWIDLEVVVFAEDKRFTYGEQRYRAWGHIDGVAHCLAYTMRSGRVRPISLRRAHTKEMKRHGASER